MKVEELTNEQLNYWTAIAQGWKTDPKVNSYWRMGGVRTVYKWFYIPSTDWKQAGELIENYNLSLYYDESFGWSVDYGGSTDVYADTPQRAICMAVTTSKFGYEVDD